jgi:hypothetical protein
MPAKAHPDAIVRREGVNENERCLKDLCDRAFLTLWSYPGVHKSPGQEACDLLVVSGNDVIIFSDKAGPFSESVDVHAGWAKWYRKAVGGSLDQLRGAERWLKQHPERLYVDAACTQPLPLQIPDPTLARYHRVAVVHGASKRHASESGGSGALAIVPGIVGPAHCAAPKDGGKPFAIGQVDPAFGYVHIMDSPSLDILLSELDTVSDLLAYLRWKEDLIENGRLERASGEPDLLAYYIERIRVAENYSPSLPEGVVRLSVPAGAWDRYKASEARQSRQQANESSRVIDRLVEQFNRNAFARTEYDASTPSVAGLERIMRFLSREPRTRRRIIGNALETLLRETPADHYSAVTVVHPSEPGDPRYVLLLLSPHHRDTRVRNYAEYREFRLWMLGEYCRAVRYQFPDAQDIVGIATDLTQGTGRSEVAVYYDGRNFTEQDAVAAQALIERTGALQGLRHTVGVASYFGDAA